MKQADIDWQKISDSLDLNGYAVTAPILGRQQCERIAGYYTDQSIAYRSTIKMARYNFGSGEYKYFAYPLPVEIQALRETFYAGLVDIANDWERRLGNSPDWPDTLGELGSRCHAAGQTRPTPLLLKYGKGDYNCLHQDLYGPIHFPLQVIILLSKPESDFSGGELILVEQRPRLQSRPMVVPLHQGVAAIIPVRERPRKGSRGYHRAPMKHGVSEIREGSRQSLGLIFHDAT